LPRGESRVVTGVRFKCQQSGGTSSFLGEGFDGARLDTLVLAFHFQFPCAARSPSMRAASTACILPSARWLSTITRGNCVECCYRRLQQLCASKAHTWCTAAINEANGDPRPSPHCRTLSTVSVKGCHRTAFATRRLTPRQQSNPNRFGAVWKGVTS
jgi:hypothetical protein